MMEVINSLVQSPFGIVVAMVMGLVLLLFSLWFGFFVVALPVGAVISDIKPAVETPTGKTEKPITTPEPALELTTDSYVEEERKEAVALHS